MSLVSELKTLKITDIVIGDENSRGDIGDLSDLMSSIKQHGVLQSPGVSKRADGTYHLMFGFRRINALTKLGVQTVEVKVFDDVEKSNEQVINLIENVQRKSLTTAEIGKHIRDLQAIGYNIKEIAQRTGLSNVYIKNAMSAFHRIPEKWRDKIQVVTRGQTIEPGRISVPNAMAIVRARKKMDLSVNDPIIDEVYKFAMTPMFSAKNILTYVDNLKAKRPISHDTERYVRLSSPGSMLKSEMTRLRSKYLDTGMYNSVAEVIRDILADRLEEKIEITTS